ncbi:prolipoprotein diacylglyceryl transferase [Virgibacillus halodenitrificans]|uniref:prolipoprotein diacylglyceryl transferase n=1 Tax=Virgibacillus halodenitrificans TaxID=1482 RepID=UPI000300E78B|nr:prolipoprotein diacylglyceryl transferase [Virgibacillus halodenitrificans]MEC2160507.1 prolipoprotein diacylglyceryl transferase [Virgibacillus halodenitrificans]MYL56973.1 prolipoprotein diacylglyceryl transferase [Virgibacillus halodenitrificans]
MSCQAPALDRVFLEIGPLPIYWYGVIIATGAFLGLYLATKESDRLGMKKDLIVDFVVFAIPIAILFARIYYVIFEWENYADGPWTDIFAIWEGGIAIHGAVIGGVLTAIVFTRIKKISFWQLADIIAPSLILGQAIGRWGNFMNQEAHGGAISEETYNSFHQYLPDFIMNQMCIEGVMYHPTFLYESIWNLIVFAFLLILRRYNPLRGDVFLSYVIAYSVGRFFIEGMRTDSLYAVGDLRQAQLISVIGIVTAIIILVYRHIKGPKIKYAEGKVSAKKKIDNKKKNKKKK